MPRRLIRPTINRQMPRLVMPSVEDACAVRRCPVVCYRSDDHTDHLRAGHLIGMWGRCATMLKGHCDGPEPRFVTAAQSPPGRRAAGPYDGSWSRLNVYIPSLAATPPNFINGMVVIASLVGPSRFSRSKQAAYECGIEPAGTGAKSIGQRGRRAAVPHQVLPDRDVVHRLRHQCVPLPVGGRLRLAGRVRAGRDGDIHAHGARGLRGLAPQGPDVGLKGRAWDWKNSCRRILLSTVERWRAMSAKLLMAGSIWIGVLCDRDDGDRRDQD